MKRTFSTIVAIGLATMALSANLTGKQATEELRKFSTELGKQGLDRAATLAKYEAKANEIIGDLKPADVPVEEAADWASIFEAAKRKPEAVELSRRAFQYLGDSARLVQERLLQSYIDSKNYEGILELLKRPVDLLGSPVIGQMGDQIRYGLDSVKVTKPYFLIQCYDLLLDRVHPERAVTKSDKYWEPYIYSSLICNKLEILAATGKKTEALKELKVLRKKMEAYPDSGNAFKQPPTYPVDQLIQRLQITDAMAPKLVVDAKIGDFVSLDAWKGKVVIVDFFAHWCGPCIRSFPTLQGYINDYGSKGLNVVGVTSFYGSYGATKDVSRADELTTVKNKFVPAQKMTWPIVFDGKQISQAAFAVEAIPHLVIIDRKGKIRHVEVGFTPAHEADIRELIETCLAEK